MTTPLRVLLFLLAGTVVAGGGAYMSGALDPYFAARQDAAGTAEPARPTAEAVPAQPADAKNDRVDAKPEDKSSGNQDVAAADPKAPAETPKPAEPTAQPPMAGEAMPAVDPSIPTFDVLRVEADGSVVIAGKAAPGAKVELLNQSAVIGSSVAADAGDFVVVLDTNLKPGDYQITIRATNPDGKVATSTQTAVVSIPPDPKGAVLAMIEEPGKPSEIITAPQPAATASASGADQPKPAETAAATGEPAKPAATPVTPAPADVAAATPEPVKPSEAKPAEAMPAVPAAEVAVEAVEIEGSRIFVAGRAPSASTIRVYANESLLGETKASAANRFLVEAQHDLAVGNYMVRADMIGTDGVKVVARAAVPFEREPGENVAAVAPPPAASTEAPEKTADATPPPVVANEPAPAATPPASGAAATQPPASGTATAEQPAATVEAPAPPADATKPADTSKPAEVAAVVPPVNATGPALTNVDGAVIIRRGDSLWRISKRVYGRGVRYSTIYLANQDQITDPNRIWPGQVFEVPTKTDQGESADMKAIGTQATSRKQ